jgi:hypothetical protein
VGYHKDMMNFAFTKKSRLDPEIWIDISIYLSDDKETCLVSIDTFVFDDNRNIRFVPISGFKAHYDYDVRTRQLKTELELRPLHYSTRIPW